MEIGKKLKEARLAADLTLEQAAQALYVSRQTISNWENEKAYPDIVSVIKLSDLYCVSLDGLLKGDARMLEHLEECTDIVKSSQTLIAAVIVNIVVFLAALLTAALMPQRVLITACVFCLSVVSLTFLIHQFVKDI